MFIRSNCDRKSQLSGILTEQLDPRDFTLKFDPYSKNKNKVSFKVEIVAHYFCTSTCITIFAKRKFLRCFTSR